LVMKWLTRDWQGFGRELTEAEVEALEAGYRAHIEAVRPRLPAALRLFAGEQDDLGWVSLHDGVVEWWVLDRPRSLTLQLFCGDGRIGYRRIVLQYRGRVELIGADERDLARWLDDPHTEFLYNEIDILDDRRFEHRHLLWPQGEFGVRFEDVVVVSAPVPGSTFTLVWRRKRLEASRAFTRPAEAWERLKSLTRRWHNHVRGLRWR
jgi:hypothetical protein